MGLLILKCVFLLLTQVGSVYAATAQPCAPEACGLPSCRCAGTDIPGGLAANATPQMITISFDDAVRVIDHEMFFKRILAGRKNPNGCDIRFTFFVSHDNTDYALLQTLAAEGHEMASHSITHRTELDTWWHGGSVENMTGEIVGMRDMMQTWGGLPRDSVKGWRAPFLATSENQIRVLQANNFTYESSMQTPPGTGPSRSTTSLPCVTLLLPVPLRPTRGCGSSQTYVSYRKMAPAVECLTVARTRRTSSKSMTCLWPTLSDITMAIEHLSGYTSMRLGSLTQLRTALKDCCSF